MGANATCCLGVRCALSGILVIRRSEDSIMVIPPSYFASGRNEPEVGEALQAGLAANGIARENIFVNTKLWNSNHRPERVEPAFDASLDRLRLD